MPYDITMKDEPEELVASIRQRVDFAHVGVTIPVAFQRLWSCVEPVGYGEGMPGMVIHEMEADVADLEIFMPVARSFDPPDDVTVTTLPGAWMAATTHIGSYDTVASAYTALSEWIGQHALHIVGPPREYYLNDPFEVGLDNAETEIEFPVAVA